MMDNNLLGSLGAMDLGSMPGTEAAATEGTADAAGLAAMTAFGGDGMGNDGGIEYATEDYSKANENFFRFMQSLGRLKFFITKTPQSIKVQKQSIPVLDANNRYIVKEGVVLTDEEKKDYEQKGKLKKSQAVTKTVVGFREAKPGQICGGVLSMPVVAAENQSIINDITSAKKVEFDDKRKDLVTKIFSAEELYSTISLLFHGVIKEDEAVVGSDARWLKLEYKGTNVKKKKDADTAMDAPAATTQEKYYRPVLQVNKNEGYLLKSLLTEKNYFPVAVYEELSQQSLTEEQAVALNTALEATIKNFSDYDKLDAETKEHIKWDDKAEHPVTSDYFKAGGKCTPIVVPKFYDKSAMLSDVRIPTKYKKESKKTPGKFQYSFMTYKLDDTTNGPLSKPQYQELAKLSGLETNEFIRVLKNKAVSKSKGNSKTKGDVKSVDQYIAAMSNGGGDIDFKNFMMSGNDLMKALQDIA